MGNEDLGTHYYNIGDLVNASKAYSRMRDYCNTPSHIASTAFRIMAVAVEQRNWMAVQSQVVKIQNLQMKPEDEARYKLMTPAFNGLQRMSNAEYKDAAQQFLLCDPMIGDQMNATMSANDIAVYGGLCALASMSRSELQSRVLDNATFRSFLELEPHIRRAVSFFVACKYTQCLEILESYRTDYLLDLYLQPHVQRLYQQVREKSIVQYFEPFGSVRLETMEKVFGAAALKTSSVSNGGTTNGETQISHHLLEELIYLIKDGKLSARLDLEKNLLVADRPDARAKTYNDAVSTLDKFSDDAYLKLMRISMINAGLETKMPSNANEKKGGSAIPEWDDDEVLITGSNTRGGGHILGGGPPGGRLLRSSGK